jgi:hypothetical protein
MADAVKKFLAAIGPRRLTDEEARQLQMLRIEDGHDDDTGFIEILAERAAKRVADKGPGPGRKK